MTMTKIFCYRTREWRWANLVRLVTCCRLLGINGFCSLLVNLLRVRSSEHLRALQHQVWFYPRRGGKDPKRESLGLEQQLAWFWLRNCRLESIDRLVSNKCSLSLVFRNYDFDGSTWSLFLPQMRRQRSERENPWVQLLAWFWLRNVDLNRLDGLVFSKCSLRLVFRNYDFDCVVIYVVYCYYVT